MTTKTNKKTLSDSTNLADYRAAGGESMSSVNQRILGQFVEREVVHCVSCLVGHFAKNDAACCDGISYDEILDLCRNVDYQEAAEQAGWEAFADEFGAKCYRDTNEGWTWAGDSWEDLCREFDIDLEAGEREVYEHWAVSGFLGEKLKAHGETVGELLDFDAIWGRCTTGQAISLDYVIQAIAAEMQILDGQAYSWAKY